MSLRLLLYGTPCFFALLSSSTVAATNPGCWINGFTELQCCSPPVGGPCWDGNGSETREHGRRTCCEQGGYLLDLARATSPPDPLATATPNRCTNTAAERYFLPADYIANQVPSDFVDEGCANQAPVYGFALAAARRHGIEHVVEVGGGIGEWSSLLLAQGLSLTLMDRPGPNFANATSRLHRLDPTETYWRAVAWDIDKDEMSLSLKGLGKSLIIVADVIEHLFDPNRLLLFLAKSFRSGMAQVAVVSTPDRDAFYDWRYHRGPPMNLAHVREWSLSEFARYVGCSDLPLAGLFEVEGTTVAILGDIDPTEALDVATAVWNTKGARSLNIRWRSVI